MDTTDFELPGRTPRKVRDNGDGTFSNTVALVGAVRAPTMSRVTTAGAIAAGARSVSIANVGAGDGVVLSAALKAGETVAWSAGDADTLGAIAYDATGAEFLITTVG